MLSKGNSYHVSADVQKEPRWPARQKDQEKKKVKRSKSWHVKPILCLTIDSNEFVATGGAVAANAYIDFISAFNTVSYDILRNKLGKYSID